MIYLRIVPIFIVLNAVKLKKIFDYERTINRAKSPKIDEVWHKAQKWYDANTNEGYRGIFEDIFPELKESEDERIRKALIDYFSGSHAMDTFGGIPWDRIVAWLEKQGEKPQGKSALEAIKEEKTDNQNCVKPADKVEPKFHEGEWITNGIDFTFQVRSIEDNMYLRSDDYFIDIETADKTFRLWAIQDAKDGDVLASEDGRDILIFRKVNNNISFSSYYNIARSSDTCWLNSAFLPATKEQRDQLEKAMADAGYRWNPEEKKMEKIEQKPAWSEEDEKNINELIELCKGRKKLCSPTVISYKRMDVLQDWLKFLKDRVQSQPKQEWSEEDEKLYNRICDIIHEAAFANCETDEDGKELGEYAEMMRLLKSLRPQLHWKPSDEQMDILWDAIVYVEGCNSNFKGSGSVLENLYSDLKKLRG